MARKSVKLSAAIDASLHARLSVFCSLRNVTKAAAVSDALTEYLKGIVAFDRGREKKPDRSGNKESVAAVSMVENSEPDEA